MTRTSTNLMKTHAWIKSRVNSSKTIVIDMTCGNGYDTHFLSHHCHHVYAVDIQRDAIESTKKRTAGATNITYIHSDHSTVDFSQLGFLSGAIYNLGYLPGSDKSCITHKTTTLASLKKLVPYLQDFLVITCYPRHQGGYEETKAVQEYLASLQKDITVFKYDKPLSPITYCVDLRNT